MSYLSDIWKKGTGYAKDHKNEIAGAAGAAALWKTYGGTTGTLGGTGDNAFSFTGEGRGGFGDFSKSNPFSMFQDKNGGISKAGASVLDTGLGYLGTREAGKRADAAAADANRIAGLKRSDSLASEKRNWDYQMSRDTKLDASLADAKAKTLKQEEVMEDSVDQSLQWAKDRKAAGDMANNRYAI